MYLILAYVVEIFFREVEGGYASRKSAVRVLDYFIKPGLSWYHTVGV